MSMLLLLSSISTLITAKPFLGDMMAGGDACMSRLEEGGQAAPVCVDVQARASCDRGGVEH